MNSKPFETEKYSPLGGGSFFPMNFQNMSNPAIGGGMRTEESASLSRQGPLKFQSGLSNRKSVPSSWMNIINTSFLDDLPSYISHRSNIGLNPKPEEELNQSSSHQAVSQSAQRLDPGV